jgi:hypothetical protein
VASYGWRELIPVRVSLEHKFLALATGEEGKSLF